MSANNNGTLPEGAQNQVIRQLRGRSVLLSAQNRNNSGGMSLPMVSQAASGSNFLSAQGIQPHMMHRQSSSGGLAMPGMYGSAQSHSISHTLPFPNVPQPVSGFTQQQQQPQQAQQLYSQSDNTFQLPTSIFETGPSSVFNGRVFHGYTFKDLKIEFGLSNLTDTRQAQLRALSRLEHLTENPPVLPENTIEEMQPKQVFPDYVKLADDASKAELRAAELINNEIAAESLRVDRERNNEAAKRSRRLKNENLDNANKLLVQNALHIAWLEAQLSAMGGRPEAFDSINPNIKQRLHAKIRENRDSFYEKRKKEKNKRDTKKRSEHNRKRAAQKRQLNERTVRQCIEADQAEKMLENAIQVAVQGVSETVSNATVTDAVITDVAVVDAVIVDAALNDAADAVDAVDPIDVADAVDAGVDIADSTLPNEGNTDPITQLESDHSHGQIQDQGNNNTNDVFSFAEDGDLNDSLILMEVENEWGPHLA
ncbi:hypothetical protein E4U43_003160 [Claviceps pusilla]|uniref:BZIP domain-containing protein n=1 Tax=Claviceps pusilla TaxID=123648 RepID=A0A9P7NFP0_9HYPO|nr:hypothetical protein E4U43_003160 [Claviceps pusilla]